MKEPRGGRKEKIRRDTTTCADIALTALRRHVEQLVMDAGYFDRNQKPIQSVLNKVLSRVYSSVQRELAGARMRSPEEIATELREIENG